MSSRARKDYSKEQEEHPLVQLLGQPKFDPEDNQLSSSAIIVSTFDKLIQRASCYALFRRELARYVG